MRTVKAHSSFLLAAILLMALVAAAFPFYRFYVDPDATAYLTIAGRYAAGDTARAVNGYWSPWSCWLTALLIAQGVQAFTAAIVVNTAGGLGMLLASHLLFKKFIPCRGQVIALDLTLALFLSMAVYIQTFADLWSCCFLLGALRLMLIARFRERPLLWILTGALGTLAYFAKAYSLPFFVLNTLACMFLLTNARRKENRGQWLKISLTVIGVALLLSLPWIWMLHQKYGAWMTSTAGSLNLSWYLVGHPFWKEGIGALLPPVYPDSIYYWEDPSVVNGVTPHFWSSPSLFILQGARLIYNLLKLSASMNTVSGFFLPVSLLAISVLSFSKIRARFPSRTPVVALSFVLFPLGFLLINFEPRYIWYMLPLIMLLGMLAIRSIEMLNGKIWLKRLIIAVFCLSYLPGPALEMKTIFCQGEREHNMAQVLKQAGIKGTFASNAAPGDDMRSIIRLAYFSGNQYYCTPIPVQNKEVLLKELRRYNIRYYFYYTAPGSTAIPIFTNESGAPLPALPLAGEGLTIFDLSR